MMHHLDQLKKINLPLGQYAIFGSGPLAIRGIRQADDIDLIVKPEIWQILISIYDNCFKASNNSICIGDIEIFPVWFDFTPNKVTQIIDTAEIIQGFPFVKLSYVIEWKQSMRRTKDKQDLELIKNYLNTHHTSAV